MTAKIVRLRLPLLQWERDGNVSRAKLTADELLYIELDVSGGDLDGMWRLSSHAHYASITDAQCAAERAAFERAKATVQAFLALKRDRRK